MTLQWICDYCGEPIDDGKGYLTISRDVIEMPTWIRDWELKHPASTFTAADLATCPPLIRWQTLHTGCDLGETGLYDIEVERLRSSTQVLEWTGHLMDKAWLKYTNWPEVVRLVLMQLGVAA